MFSDIKYQSCVERVNIAFIRVSLLLWNKNLLCFALFCLNLISISSNMILFQCMQWWAWATQNKIFSIHTASLIGFRYEIKLCERSKKWQETFINVVTLILRAFNYWPCGRLEPSCSMSSLSVSASAWSSPASTPSARPRCRALYSGQWPTARVWPGAGVQLGGQRDGRQQPHALPGQRAGHVSARCSNLNRY